MSHRSLGTTAMFFITRNLKIGNNNKITKNNFFLSKNIHKPCYFVHKFGTIKVKIEIMNNFFLIYAKEDHIRHRIVVKNHWFSLK